MQHKVVEKSGKDHDADEGAFNGRVFLSWNELWGLGLNNQLADR